MVVEVGMKSGSKPEGCPGVTGLSRTWRLYRGCVEGGVQDDLSVLDMGILVDGGTIFRMRDKEVGADLPGEGKRF